MSSRRARRRVFAGAAAVGLGILIVAPRAGADTLSNNFNGTKSTTPSSSSSTAISITTEWHHAGRPDPFTTVLTSPDNPSGCLAEGTQSLSTTTSSLGGDGTATTASVDVLCNGVYTWQVSTTYRVIAFTEDGTVGPHTITVAEPPPAAGKVKATAAEDGSSVSLSWSEPGNLPPDASGYRVQRETPTGGYTDLGTVKPGTHTFKDTSPPAGQSELTYAVTTQRPSPNGTLQAKASRASVEMPGPTTTTNPDGTTGGATGGTTSGTGGGTAGGTGGTAGTGGTGGGTTTGGTGGKTTTGGSHPITSFGPLNIGKTGVGVAAPNLGRASSDLSTSALPGDEDSGSYNSQLPYNQDSGDGLGGGDNEDGLSSALYENGGGRGMAVPIAVGFVFAAWAFHLRFLAKAARPTTRVAPRHGRA